MFKNEKEINISAFTIGMETTRRCNGGKIGCDGKLHPCRHCLRGNPQAVNMSDDIISAVASSSIDVGSILFTGGEPTLVPGIIEKIINKFTENNLNFESFYLVTNAVRYSPKTVNILTDLYYKIMRKPHNDFFGGLAVSRDEFYTFNHLAYLKYTELPFYCEDKEQDGAFVGIIDEGLAAENHLGVRKAHYDPEIYANHDFTNISFNMVYINAKGDVLLDCDYSYENQDKFSIGNILEKSLEEILYQYCIENKQMVDVA